MQIPWVQTSMPRIGCLIAESFLATALIASSEILRAATARAMASLRSPASVGAASARFVRPLIDPVVPVDFVVSRSIGATSSCAAVRAAALTTEALNRRYGAPSICLLVPASILELVLRQHHG